MTVEAKHTPMQTGSMKFYATCSDWYAFMRSAVEEEVGLVHKLMTWCACHPGSGGLIPDCLNWSSRTWLAEAGVKRSLLNRFLKNSRALLVEKNSIRLLVHDAARETQFLRTSELQRSKARIRNRRATPAAAGENIDSRYKGAPLPPREGDAPCEKANAAADEPMSPAELAAMMDAICKPRNTRESQEEK